MAQDSAKERAMRLPRRHFLRLAAGIAAFPAVSRIAKSEAYPTRPVRLLVGFAAGGNFDVVARIIAEWMSEQLHQPVIVENRPGASSNLATEAAVRAPADGYTLILGGAVNAVNATLFEKLSFDFMDDLTPVAGLVQFPNVMTVRTGFPAKTVSEFIAYAKDHPGKLSQGSSGRGTTQHLAGELFKIMTGTSFVHVPYRGAAPALTDLLGGQIHVLFEALPPTIEHIRAGTLRALAVTTTLRSPALPDVPTVSEFVPGYEASGWNGILATKNTPADVIWRLNAVVNAGLADPRIKARLAGLGATMLPGSPADFGKLIASETDKWRRVIRTAGIKSE
jgi:tripartite-type tricarboxylate transporter receptor subunit TctC